MNLKLLGITGLIIGNLVGAGILALPVSLGLVGFIPALISMVVYTLIMFFSADVLSHEAAEAKTGTFDYPSLYNKYLGKIGKWAAIITNMLILYGLLIAYISGGTQILADCIGLGGHTLFVAIIFSIFLVGITLFDLSVINKYNTLLIVFLFLTFLLMIVYVFPKINLSHLSVVNLKYMTLTIPLIVTAAHFHNIIPTLCCDVNWDTKLLRKAMFWGMFFAFVMNVLWTMCGIGCLNYSGDNSIVSAYVNNLPATIPMGNILQSKLFVILSVLFSIVAIVTSFLANGVGLQNFIKDLMFNTFKIEKMFLVKILTFLPPVIIAILWPNVFIKALNVAGGIGIVTLFCILPCIIAIIKKENRLITKILGGIFLIFSIIALISAIYIVFHFQI